MDERFRIEGATDAISGSRDPTLFIGPQDAGSKSGASRSMMTLPPDLRHRAMRRLRAAALIYSATFFAADWIPTIFNEGAWHRFSHVGGWIFSVGSILLGVSVAWASSSERIEWRTRVLLGLAFEVASTYGIAFTMYHWLPEMPLTSAVLEVLSPSWPALWIVFFSIVVPAPPTMALIAALAAASAPPVVIGWTLSRTGMSHLLPPGPFFFSHVFPHLVAVGLAYVGARVMYRLGRDVSKARELGSYRLTERLGRGGMGEVWIASHRMLARPAVVKFIRADAMASSSVEEAGVLLRRFELEARATASLTSEHTIRLFDFGSTEDGVFYYVMEFLDGIDLERLVAEHGPLPPARAARLLMQICDSLEEAHAKGLIHRDIKPANVYACRSGNRCDFVKVLDFGLVARQRTIDDVAMTKLTRPQQAAGTPAYMPPEVARGEPLDGRADLYAVGCVAYWLLTGRPVFQGASAYDVVSQHLRAAPDPPSRHAPGVPPALDLIVLELLAKTPAERPADARTLGRMLRELGLEHGWTDEQAEAWWCERLPARASGSTKALDNAAHGTTLLADTHETIARERRTS